MLESCQLLSVSLLVMHLGTRELLKIQCGSLNPFDLLAGELHLPPGFHEPPV